MTCLSREALVGPVLQQELDHVQMILLSCHVEGTEAFLWDTRRPTRKHFLHHSRPGDVIMGGLGATANSHRGGWGGARSPELTCDWALTLAP